MRQLETLKSNENKRGVAVLSGTCQKVMKLDKSYYYNKWGQFVE